MPWVEQRKLLTVGDLEKVTGLKGLKPHEKNNPRDQMLAFSKQENFAGKPADFLALSVTLVFLEGYWEGFAKGEKNSKAAAPVSGVGDEAFEEVKNCALFFHKGKATVLMTGAGSPLVQSCYLTAEQMREAARIIAARL
jgi:hypothetical protein